MKTSKSIISVKTLIIKHKQMLNKIILIKRLLFNLDNVGYFGSVNSCVHTKLRPLVKYL